MNSYSPQFAVAPFTSEQDPDSALSNPNTRNTQINSLYPEIYHEINSLVFDAVDQIISMGIELTPDMTSLIVDNIIRNSGMWYEDEDDEGSWVGQNLEAIPVQSGFGRMPYQRHRRRHHNRNTLRDLVRIALLDELFRRNGRRF